jgi:Spy/CpxP family protein refolding chaperone
MYRIIYAALASFSLAAVPALAGGFHEDEGNLPRLHQLLRVANLTADQKGQVHEIMRATFQQNRSIRQQLRAIREQIVDKLASSGSVSASDIAPLQQQAESLRTQLDADWLQTALKIRGLLTSTQLSHVAQVHTQMKSLKAQMKSVTGETDDEPAMMMGDHPVE